MLANFTGGMPLGPVFEACLAPVMPMVTLIRYYYYPRVMERAVLSQHGINVGLFDEVVVV